MFGFAGKIETRRFLRIAILTVLICILCVAAGYGIARLAENIGIRPEKEEPEPRKLGSLVQITCEISEYDV